MTLILLSKFSSLKPYMNDEIPAVARISDVDGLNDLEKSSSIIFSNYDFHFTVKSQPCSLLNNQLAPH